jgi:penicillin amidase
VRADSLEMAVYTQGFGHAQDRMWQMEKIRRLTAGRLAETLGEEAVGIDKFGLLCGFRRTA